MQLLLFDDLSHDPVEEGEGKVCETCGIMKKWEHFAFQGQVHHWLKYGVVSLIEGVLEDKKQYRKVCRKCESERSVQQRELRKTAPPIPECCDCCGVSFKRPVQKVRLFRKTSVSTRLDHCHDTNIFRGWLCHNCNSGIGLLGDNLEGLNKAVAYLEKFERNEDV